LHGVVDDAVGAGGVQDVVADAGVAAGLAGDDVSRVRVAGRVEQGVGEIDAEDGGAVPRERGVLPAGAEGVDVDVGICE
jgi:hypothetical protein